MRVAGLVLRHFNEVHLCEEAINEVEVPTVNKVQGSELRNGRNRRRYARELVHPGEL